ncbi:alpha-L-rhamnosidase [Lachnoclostridium sp. Marseille-P6806]|uniref:alpha-L-rhamnosidase n=1 Tax=Lachnoclostridium sp. Marseille-P6806 TaxID=2364793 RepID=UPI001030270B|nr:alpha-L-rhamnosidase [Lachnoclostridium sp. Marseille-P6806]
MKITQMKINGIEQPVGYLLEGIRASWKVTDTVSKKAVYVGLSVSADPDFRELLFHAEKDAVSSIETVIPLAPDPGTIYYWRVEVTGDAGDKATGISTFETGRMGRTWAAEWIAAPDEASCHPIFAKTFETAGSVRRARLYISAAGLFEAFLNGEKIQDEYLTPYLTNYERRLQVITLPAEDCLREGSNRLEIVLGRGWFSGLFGLELQRNNYGDRMAAIAELELIYDNGSRESILTDETWTVRGSDIRDSGIYDGETIDRLLYEGRENRERPVSVIREYRDGTRNLTKERLRDRLSLPVRVQETLPVREIIHTPAGETVLDFGQNLAGFVCFQADFERGTRILLEFGEILQQGSFYRGNYRDAVSEFRYISDGRKEEVRAHFTFFGFRYVRLSGWPGEPRASDFTGCVLYSSLSRSGWIETGHPGINRLYENTLWSQKSNFIDIPTDCPQRSERLGWTGDAQVFSPTAGYHMDTRAFFHKYICDLRDEQSILGGAVPNYIPNLGHKTDAGPVWGDAGTILPWNLYRYYGSLDELEQHFSMMRDWLDWLVRQDDADSHKAKRLCDFGFTFGDWLALDGPTETSFKGSTDDCYVSTAYYCHSAELVRDAAGLLAQKAEREGRAQAAERYSRLRKVYERLAEEIRSAVLNEYFTPSGRLSVDTQTGLILALKFGLGADREKLVAQLRTRLKKDLYRIKGGFVGAPLLCTVLAENGMTDIAYDFLFHEQFPGWLYEVNLGATTIWERWNSVLPDGSVSPTGMNSLNHYSYGSVMEFVYAYAAGIRPVTPGFAEALIAPEPDARLRFVRAAYDSAAGRYESGWTLHEDGTLTVSAVIPFGAKATVILPSDPEHRTLSLEAGSYCWSYRPQKDLRTIFGWDTPIRKAAEFPAALAILARLTPPLAGMCHDPEMGCHSFRDVAEMTYIPVDPAGLRQAVSELSELRHGDLCRNPNGP